MPQPTSDLPSVLPLMWCDLCEERSVQCTLIGCVRRGQCSVLWLVVWGEVSAVYVDWLLCEERSVQCTLIGCVRRGQCGVPWLVVVWGEVSAVCLDWLCEERSLQCALIGCCVRRGQCSAHWLVVVWGEVSAVCIDWLCEERSVRCALIGCCVRRGQCPVQCMVGCCVRRGQCPVQCMVGCCVSRMLTEEEEEVRIYHTLENARYYHGNTPQYIEISSEVSIWFLSAPAQVSIQIQLRSHVAFGSIWDQR